jgi:hypothetical protein
VDVIILNAAMSIAEEPSAKGVIPSARGVVQ